MIFKEELIAIWGKEFVDRCGQEAIALRKECWIKHSQLSMPKEYEADPVAELVLAIAIKKVMDLKS